MTAITSSTTPSSQSRTGDFKSTVQSAANTVGNALSGVVPALEAAAGADNSSTTVSLSDAALNLLGTLGQSASDVVEAPLEAVADVVDVPINVVKDVANGVVDAVGGLGHAGYDLVSGDLGSVAPDARTAVESLAIDAPANAIADVANGVKAVAGDAANFASGAANLASLGVL